MDSPPARRLIIFGCGYVGGAVARRAIEAGWKVHALTRNPQKAAALRNEGIEVVLADLASDAWHATLAGGADFVLNAVSSGGSGVEGYRHSYVEGMRSILKWVAGGSPVGTLVYTSSTSVYPQDGGIRVDEAATTSVTAELPAVLLEAEGLLRDAFDGRPPNVSRPSRYFIFRLAGIYGPGRRHLVEQVRSGSVAGNGNHRLNLIHRDDIVDAIWLAFNAPESVPSGIFNLADDGAAPKKEVVEWMAAEMGLPPPSFTGQAAAGRRAITPDRIIDNAKIKSLLGWRPRFPSFRDGYKNRLALDSD